MSKALHNPHYSEKERADTLSFLLTSLEREKRVAGIVIVGSAAEGFDDAFSDIDLVAVTRNEDDVHPTFLDWGRTVCEALPVKFKRELPRGSHTFLWIFLLSNFLELNVSFLCVEQLRAVKNRWRVHLDRTGKISGIMESSWHQREAPDLEAEYRARMASFWYYIIHADTAIRRGKYWRALFEVEIIRNRTIELRSLRMNLNTKRFREVDQLPPSFLNDLTAAMPANLTPEALHRSLHAVVRCFFQEARQYDELLNLDLGRQLESKMDAYFLGHGARGV